MSPSKQQRPPQQQSRQPGLEKDMTPRPKSEGPEQGGCGKLLNKVALITGGDSGIGRAVAIAYAKEGADTAIVYYDEHEDAKETQRLVEQAGSSVHPHLRRRRERAVLPRGGGTHRP